MKQHKNTEFNPYNTQIIEFTKIGVTYAKLIENVRDKKKFITQAINILPILYYHLITLPDYIYNEGEDFVETYVSEVTYEHLRISLAELLKEDDNFLTAQDDNIDYSETTLLASIAEYLLDVYQNVGDLLGIIRSQNTIALPLAIGRCKLHFHQYFGSHLILALSALHRINSKQLLENEEQEDSIETSF